MGLCEITKNQINLDLIGIIQFCLKIYDLWRHPTYGGVWVVQWLDGWMGWWVGSCSMSNH